MRHGDHWPPLVVCVHGPRSVVGGFGSVVWVLCTSTVSSPSTTSLPNQEPSWEKDPGRKQRTRMGSESKKEKKGGCGSKAGAGRSEQFSGGPRTMPAPSRGGTSVDVLPGDPPSQPREWKLVLLEQQMAKGRNRMRMLKLELVCLGHLRPG